MLESELFWNALVVFKKVPMRNQRGFLDIVLKRIATIHPNNYNSKKKCRYCCKHTTHHEIKK